MLSSKFSNIRSTGFDQSSPVQPISEYRGGSLSVTYVHSSSRTGFLFSNSLITRFWVKQLHKKPCLCTLFDIFHVWVHHQTPIKVNLGCFVSPWGVCNGGDGPHKSKTLPGQICGRETTNPIGAIGKSISRPMLTGDGSYIGVGCVELCYRLGANSILQ